MKVKNHILVRNITAYRQPVGDEGIIILFDLNQVMIELPECRPGSYVK